MHILARNWWALVLRGVLAVLFGVLAYLWPGLTIASLVVLFGAYALVDGLFSLLAAFRRQPGESRGWLVFNGILGVLAGIVVLTRPGLSAVFLFYLIACWAIVTGIAQIVAAVALRKVIRDEWLLVLAGLLSIALGVLMLMRPAAGVLGLVWAIALFAIATGVSLIALGFRLRSWARSPDRDAGATVPV
jgi:uncharacterized membrane protein HdeD (DUF308 family)